MTIPTDSVAPVAIESSDPWWNSGMGTGALIRGLKRVTAWITGLSPAGSTTYDTGWIPLTVTPGVATGVFCDVRRIGKLVLFRTEFHTVAAGTLCVIPVGFRTLRRTQAIALRYASSTTNNYASLACNTDGVVLVSIVGTAVTTTPGYTAVVTWTTD